MSNQKVLWRLKQVLWKANIVDDIGSENGITSEIFIKPDTVRNEVEQQKITSPHSVTSPIRELQLDNI